MFDDSAAGKEAVFASPTLQDAILRNIQVLCESTQRLSDAAKERHPEVDWRAVSGLRNVLVHDYFAVDLDSIWTVTQRDLPVLAHAMEQLLRETAGG